MALMFKFVDALPGNNGQRADTTTGQNGFFPICADILQIVRKLELFRFAN